MIFYFSEIKFEDKHSLKNNKTLFSFFMIEHIYKLHPAMAFLYFLILNIAIFIISVIIGKLVVSLFSNKRITPVSEKTSLNEILFSCSTVILNALITLVGWFLWQWNLITITYGFNIYSIIDFFVIFFVMDFFMYFLHRIAHIPLFYNILHARHHKYRNVSPITLFVLNPIENISFGILWVIFLCFYSTSWFSVSLYLAVNVIFGIIGHLGVEPLPASTQKNIFLRFITTSYFHAVHHNYEDTNFGFYTLIWDKLFNTLAKFYYSHFGYPLYRVNNPF